jgi:hypothetical protein
VATYLQVDPSSPTDTDLTGQAATAVSNAFSPPAKSLVIIFAGQGKTNSASSSSMTISDTSGATWNAMPYALGTSASGGGVTGWWAWFDQAPGSITVTINYAGWSGTGGGRFINPLVFAGAHWDQSGAGMASRVSAVGSTDATVNINVSARGSWLWGIMDAPNINTTFTASGANILDTTYSGGATDGVTMIITRQSGVTASAGTFTVGGTWGSATAFTNVIAFEVLPSRLQGQKLTLWHPGKGLSRLARHNKTARSTTRYVAELQDNFNDNAIDVTKWPNNFGTVTETGGRARVNCATTTSAYQSGFVYSLKDSAVSVQLLPAAVNAGTTVLTQLAVLADNNGTDVTTQVILDSNQIIFKSRAAFADPSPVTLTYDPVAHAYVRIREAAGTTYWDTSPDGLTWTNQRASASPSWVGGLTSVLLSSSRATGTTNFAEFDNLNVAPLDRTFSDSAPASDTMARTLILPRGFSDSAPAGDAVARIAQSFTRTLTDSAPASDAMARTLVQPRTLTDSAPASDSISRTLALPRAFTDGAPAADSITRGAQSFTRTLTDSAPASDTMARTLVLPRTLTDSAPASDSVTRGAQSFTRTLTDSAPASDIMARTQVRVRTLADSAPAADSITRTLVLPRTLSDSAPATDSIARGAQSFTRTLTDSAPATDSFSRTLVLPRALADSAPASDTMARTQVRARTMTDSAPAADSMTRTLVLPRSLADSAPATDSFTRTLALPRTLSDSAPVSDSISRTLALPRGFGDSASAADAFSRTLVLPRTLTDSAPASDTMTAVSSGGTSRTMTDAAPASDAMTRTLALARALADSAPASDVFTRTLSRPRTMADSAPAADTVSRTVALPRAMADNAPALDLFGRTVISQRAMADSAPASDVIAHGPYRYVRVFSDTASAVDAMTRGLTLGRGFSDSAAATDVFTRVMQLLVSRGQMFPVDRGKAGMTTAPRGASVMAPAVRGTAGMSGGSGKGAAMVPATRGNSTMTGA